MQIISVLQFYVKPQFFISHFVIHILCKEFGHKNLLVISHQIEPPKHPNAIIKDKKLC